MKRTANELCPTPKHHAIEAYRGPGGKMEIEDKLHTPVAVDKALAKSYMKRTPTDHIQGVQTNEQRYPSQF